MKILYFGRKNCKRSDKLRKFLKKKTKNFYHFEVSRDQKNNFNLNDLIKIEFDFIISFRSFFIIPKKLLNKSKLSINFHPGTPRYRGIGCINYAIYNNENFFGSTAHLINEQIDNGPIINVKKFKIKKSLDLNGVLELTWDNMLKQSIEILDKAFKDEKFIKIHKKIIKVKNGLIKFSQEKI